jgi:hypothetical protein
VYACPVQRTVCVPTYQLIKIITANMFSSRQYIACRNV